MMITKAMAHTFGIVSTELRKIYAAQYGVKESEVHVILQGKLCHVLKKGKLTETVRTAGLHKLRPKEL